MSFLDSSYASGSFLGADPVTKADAFATSTSEMDRMEEELTSGNRAAPAVARVGASADEIAAVKAYNESEDRATKDLGLSARGTAAPTGGGDGGGTTVTRTDPATGKPAASSRWSFPSFDMGQTSASTAASLAQISARTEAGMTAVNRAQDAAFGIRPRGTVLSEPAPSARVAAKPGMSKQTMMIIGGVAVLGLALLLMRKN
jgi:hypothetical protein